MQFLMAATEKPSLMAKFTLWAAQWAKLQVAIRDIQFYFFTKM
jgi:hypothetical protein